MSGADGQSELLGRAVEEKRIRRLLAAARRSRSGVIVIRGEAGTGKTALLHQATAYKPRMNVLQTRCAQSEAAFAFGALGDLLRPVLPLVDRLPTPQRQALRVSLALDEAGDQPPSAAAIGFGTLSVLAEAAPTLVVVDDIQWMDAGSRAALLFAARRLAGEGVAVLIAIRGGEPAEDLADLPTLEIGGLSAEAARELVARVRGETPDDSQLASLLRHSGGHPLALRPRRGARPANSVRCSTPSTALPGHLTGCCPSELGPLARELRWAARHLARVGALSGRGHEKFATAALLVALASLIAEIGAWRQLRGRVHQAAAADRAARAIPTGTTGPSPRLGAGARPTPPRGTGPVAMPAHHGQVSSPPGQTPQRPQPR